MLFRSEAFLLNMLSGLFKRSCAADDFGNFVGDLSLTCFVVREVEVGDSFLSEIVNRKPRFICIEDLNVSGMMKNRHLSKAVREQGFFLFRKQLEYKCNDKGIPLIVADRFYPSSKLCSCCGNIKKDLKLSDRIYRCECGNIIDRDFQASINLKAYGERFAS